MNPSVAAHPLVLIESSKKNSAEFDHALAAELKKLKVPTADRRKVKTSLSSMPSNSCLGHDDCLAALARDTGTTYALLMTVAPDAPKLVVSARLVRADGELVRQIDGRAFKREPKGKRATQVRTALRKVLAELELQALPTTVPDRKEPEPSPAVETEPEKPVEPGAVTPPAPVAAPPTPPAAALSAMPVSGGPIGVEKSISPERETGGWMRPTSYVLGGAALAAAGAGGFFYLQARNDAKQLRGLVETTGGQPDDQILKLQRSLATKDRLTSGLFIGAGSALVTGAALFFLAPSEPQRGLAVGPGPGGLGVSVSGSLP